MPTISASTELADMVGRLTNKISLIFVLYLEGNIQGIGTSGRSLHVHEPQEVNWVVWVNKGKLLP